MATPPLSVEGLEFGYAAAPLFFDWSHDFVPGLTWLRGDNGSGKSTLLRLLGGALEADGGTIRLGDVTAHAQPLAYRRRVYWCGPDGVAFDHLRPAEFFGFVAGLYPTFDASVVDRWVDAFGLRPFLPRRIRELSTGTRRKVAVVAAFAVGTDVVLLDEPLAGLDRASLATATAHLAKIADARDRVWIVASHEPLGPAQGPAHTVDLAAKP